jgi:tetratricopeptide (TPR) repeat protein
MHLSRRRHVLLALFLLLIPAFAVTGLATRSYRATQQRLGDEWFALGEERLKGSQPAAAVEAFRTALSLSRDPAHRLRLAQALAAAGRRTEARAHLLTLRESGPGDGLINLELARLEAREGNVREATEYYHDAVAGAWNQATELRRREARLELTDMLLRAGAAAEAQAELVALASDLPDEAAAHVRVADLLLRAGNAERALETYRSALALEPRSAPALAGAGEAAFRLRYYVTARRYFASALGRSPGDERLVERNAVIDAVLTLDPFRRGLTSRERARRALRARDTVLASLQACAATEGVALYPEEPAGEPLPRAAAALRALEPRVRPATLWREPDLVDELMDRVFEAEAAVTAACGASDPSEQALNLIARDRQLAER